MTLKADIDIDLGDRNNILSKIINIPASIITKNSIKKHNSGVYLQNIPIDQETKQSSIDYKTAETFGFIKFDFLNNNIYKKISSMKELEELENTEPNWDLLKDRNFVKKLNHIGNHFNIIQKIQPKNIDDLAIILALIRPGKRHLLELKKSEIKEKIWNNDETGNKKGYSYKKSHAYAYAKSIIVQMNYICKYEI